MGQLHEAAKKNDMNTIIKLAGTNGEEYIRKKDLNHNNILHIACFHGHQSLFSYAMSKTDINAENLGGDTPLIIAAKQSNMDFAKRLITAGADGISINTVNKPNNHGNTPLHYACFWRCAEIVNLLIASHCNIGVKNNYGQVTYFNTSFKIEEQIKGF
jgi:integrin-linked kinase